MATLSNWSPYGEYVQGGMVDGRFMNAAYTMIAAGPPRLANMGLVNAGAAVNFSDEASDQLAFPIGVVQNFSISHNMTVSRFYELGSVRSYFIPGRVMGQANLGRIMYHGPSLLRVLYAYYQDAVAPATVDTLLGGVSASTMPNPHNVKIQPGFENVYLNLASDLFTQPIGLLLMLKDSNEDTMAAVYLESCYIPNHSLSTDAMGTVIQEQVSIQFERAVPIATSVVGLITGEE